MTKPGSGSPGGLSVIEYGCEPSALAYIFAHRSAPVVLSRFMSENCMPQSPPYGPVLAAAETATVSPLMCVRMPCIGTKPYVALRPRSATHSTVGGAAVSSAEYVRRAANALPLKMRNIGSSS